MKLLSVNVSRPRTIQYDGKPVETGIFKEPVEGRVMLRGLNIDGDGQADLVGHGGIYKAAYVYSIENYRYWETALGRTDFSFGQFGENFTVENMLDEDVHVGDIFRIGGALAEVTQPRVPCFKLAHKMDIAGFEHVFLESGRPGFYLRVLEEGEVAARDAIERVAEGPERMSVAAVNELLYFDLGNIDDTRRVLRIPALSPGWRGSFEERIAKADRTGRSAESFRTLVVDRVERESATISSYYLRPEDGGALPPFLPGQFLPLRIAVPGEPNPLNRTYSLSDRPGQSYYRLSIKRESPPPDSPDAPAGRSSTYFHDAVAPGTRLRVRAPRGKFSLDPTDPSPVALVSAGVGLTPMISMLNAIVASGTRRPVWFIHGARNGAEHAMGPHVRRLAAENDHVRSHIRYSRPGPEDEQAREYDSEGHVDAALIARELPDLDIDFYLCGPTPFLKSLYDGLIALGVSEERIHYEFFGPASALHEADGAGTDARDEADRGAAFEVTFKRSGVGGTWKPSYGTLLDMAEELGLNPPYSCRSGICQTCLATVASGDVDYVEEPLDLPEEGTALICCSRPTSNIVIDI